MKNKSIKRIKNFNVLDEQLSDEVLTGKLKQVIKRIDIFLKMIGKYSFSNKHIIELYDGFLNTNLLNLYCFADALKLNKQLNKYNPFGIGSHMYNSYKHIGAEHDVSLNLVSKTHNVSTKFNPKGGYRTIDELEITSELMKRFGIPILNDGMKKSNINSKLDFGIEIQNFIKFIIENKPNDFLHCSGSDFEKLKFELWKWYKE